MPTESARSGQVPIKTDMMPDKSSTGSGGGQVPVNERADGDRGGSHAGRGCVSPLGGNSKGYENILPGRPIRGSTY